jgi:hypothetical protein
MKKLFVLFTVIIFLLSSMDSLTQGVAINNDGSQPNPRALLDLKSTNKGFFLPRMNSMQRVSIPATSSDAGLLVFDTDKNTIYIFTGVKWMPISFNSENDIAPINYSVNDSSVNDYLGYGVAIDGDYAIAGAYGDNINGSAMQGSSYIFHRSANGWVQQAKLIASDGAAFDKFGAYVAISGNYAIVGANGADINGKTDQGAAYVFIRNGNNWTQQAKLTASDGEENDLFGKVAIEGNRIVIGAPYDHIGSNNGQGSVYVFVRNGTTWSQTAKLLSSDGASLDQFGYDVDISGDYIVVGASNKAVNGIAKAGAVYIFNTINGADWIEQKKMLNFVPAYEDYFGASVAINNDKVVIGVPGKDKNGVEAVGMIYISRRDGLNWVTEQSITPFENIQEGSFGASVDIIQDLVMVGVPRGFYNGLSNVGKVYIYEKPSLISSWIFKRTISNPESGWNTFFGISCSMDKLTGRYIVGSYGKYDFTGEISFGILY